VTTSHATRWITPDLLDVSGVSLPQTFAMAPGATIDITFPDRRVGTMTITGAPKPGVYRGRWTCAGSKYDGKRFDLTWGTRSDVSALGQPIMVPVTMVVVAG
jgi:hypothetical protein